MPNSAHNSERKKKQKNESEIPKLQKHNWMIESEREKTHPHVFVNTNKYVYISVCKPIC